MSTDSLTLKNVFDVNFIFCSKKRQLLGSSLFLKMPKCPKFKFKTFLPNAGGIYSNFNKYPNALNLHEGFLYFQTFKETY